MTYTLDEIRSDWLKMARAIIIDEQSELRAGPNNTVQVKSRRTDCWHRLQFGQSDTFMRFATAKDRDVALAILNGEAPFPEGDNGH